MGGEINCILRYALPKVVQGMKNGRRNILIVPLCMLYPKWYRGGKMGGEIFKLYPYVCSTQNGTGDE